VTDPAAADPTVRDRLAIALDVPDLASALRLATEVAPWFGVAKVGLELYAAAGPRAVAELREQGLDVFVDLKLHDIPTTVERAARVLGGLGARYLNFHAAGGVAMLRAGVEGLGAGARDAGCAPPVALAVTVLTSDSDTSAFAPRLAAAIEAGCGGVVCAAAEVGRVREVAPGLVTMVPGIRFADGALDDQVRVATPGSAAAAGAGVLVIGRSVSGADDPAAAARRAHEEVAAAVGR